MWLLANMRAREKNGHVTFFQSDSRCCDPAPQLRNSNGSLGGGIFTSDGSTPQMSQAYWEMVRSLENFPEAAMLRITILVHSLGFWWETGNMFGEALLSDITDSSEMNTEKFVLACWDVTAWTHHTGCYLVQLTDSLLTFDISFKISEHLEPKGRTEEL